MQTLFLSLVCVLGLLFGLLLISLRLLGNNNFGLTTVGSIVLAVSGVCFFNINRETFLGTFLIWIHENMTHPEGLTGFIVSVMVPVVILWMVFGSIFFVSLLLGLDIGEEEEQ